MNTLHRFYLGAVTAALTALAPGLSGAADFPNHQVRFVVPSTPGGALDVLARIMSAKLTEKWGQPIVVDNRGGAGGIIGTDIVAKAPPDGHTLLIVTTGFVTNPYLYKNLPYRTPNAFTPITILASTPNVLVAHPSLPVRTLQELVAMAKAKPGALNYASSGVGSGGHLTMEFLKQRAGFEVTHVPYKGAGDATGGVVSGQTQLFFTAIGAVLPQINAKALNALAVSGAKRSEALPNVPTVAESGVPGFVVDSWYAIMGPANMPKETLDRIYRDVAEVLKTPAVIAQFRTLGFEIGGMPPREFADYVRAELKTWGGALENSPTQDGAKVQ